MLNRSTAMALEQKATSSTSVPLLDQPFIFTEVWAYLNASSKKALRLVCKPLRLAVDEHVKQVAWLASLDEDIIPMADPQVQPANVRFFEAAGQRWTNVKRIALSCVVDLQALRRRSNDGGDSPFPRLQAMTIRLVGG
jgi:hypothetical protein